MGATYKIGVYGGGGVGKSSLVIRLTSHHFPEEYDPTIEDTYRKSMEVDNMACLLDILDTASYGEEFATLFRLNVYNYRNCILVYSITSRTSFEQITQIWESIISILDTENFPLVLVGNKCDLESSRQVSKEEGEALAKKLRCPFIETSAKTNINVEEAFTEIVRRCMRFDAPTSAAPRTAKKAYSPFKGLEALFKCFGTCAVGVGAIFILPIIFLLLFLIILPYQFMTVIFFPSTIEVDSADMKKRSEELDRESTFRKGLRVLGVVSSSLPMTFLLLVYPIILVKVIIPTYGADSYSTYWLSIGSFLLILLLMQIMATIRHYISFEVKRPRSAEEDKPAVINWKNYKNWIILLALILEFIQIFTMPIKFAESVISEEGRKILAPFFLDVYLLAENATSGVDFSYYFSVATVMALVVAVCIQSVIDLKRAYISDDYDREEKFFWSFTGSMIYGHNQIKEEPKIGSTISVLADGLFIIVVSNLLNVVSCNYDGSDPVLVFSPSDHCWTDSHSTKAIIALICLGYYVPISILVGPMLTESGESKETKDIKFRTSYMMVVSSLKVLPFLVPVVFQQTQNSRLASALVADLLCTMITFAWVFLKAPELQAPCSVPVINIWRSLPYIGGCLSAIALIAEIPQWGLLLLILIPVGMLLAFWTFRTSTRLKEVVTLEMRG